MFTIVTDIKFLMSPDEITISFISYLSNNACNTESLLESRILTIPYQTIEICWLINLQDDYLFKESEMRT